MKEYLLWSLRQFYLLLFWPTQYAEEFGSPRLKELYLYVLKMFPWMVALAVVGNLIVGYICEAFGIAYRWMDSWRGVGYGVTLGIMAGIAGSIAFGVAGGVVGGLTGGVPEGVVGGVVFGAAFGVSVGFRTGIMVGIVFGVDRDIAFSVPLGIIGGVGYGLIGGDLGGGIIFGAVGSIAFLLTHFRIVMYPLNIAVSIIAYLTARWWPHRTARAWQLCPVVWNESIWLPLPFASKLLALFTQQDREEGFRQVAFVIEKHNLPRRVALAALVELAVNDLKASSLSKLADVTDKLNWTTDIPANLPDELTSALPRFDRAAQHIGQYLILDNAYRKAEALRRAITEVESLQRSLIAARGRFAPRLLQAANKWRSLLDAELETIKALAEASREIPNPFVFGNPVVETEYNVFTGRRDIVKKIEASILGAGQTPTLLLHGPRRMGKTSILNQLPRLLGPDFAPALIDCQNPAITESRSALLRYLSRALSEGLRRKRVTMEPLTSAMLEREPFAAFDDWLGGVERKMPDGLRVLLCMDEYERLQSALDAGWGTAFLDALRHLLQHRPRVILMFTGARTFQELGPQWTDRFISARRIRVSFLTREEVMPLLTTPIPEFDMTYADGALDTIITATNGQPFLTQGVAFELVQLLNEQQRKKATADDAEQAITRALGSGSDYFANVWSDAGEQGRMILRTIIAGDAPPDFPAARKWLRDHDVLNDAGEFAVPMVRRWVKEKTAV